jgi:tetratricopeptide (TPR) repeat protein
MKATDLHKTSLHILLIVLLSLIAYSNTFHVPFYFDDERAIINNPVIKDLQYFVQPSKAKPFTGLFEYSGLKNRYFSYLIFALNYRLHGLDVPGYHAVNLLIHILTSLLVYLFVLLTFQTPFLRTSPFREREKQTALLTALLFACHPIQTQAVTYIFQRVASLAALLYLLSLVSYIKFRLNIQNSDEKTQNLPGKKNSIFGFSSVLWSLCSLISAVLAMKSKETAFMLPVTVTLYEFIFFKGRALKRIFFVVPLLLTMLIIPLTLFSIDKPPGELIGEMGEEIKGKTHTAFSQQEYLRSQFRVLLTYLRLIVLPVNQNLDYDYPKYHSFFQPDVFGSFLLLALIFGLGIFVLYRYRHTAPYTRLIAFGIFWFFINLALESSVIPLHNVIFEHRMYLPSIGVFMVISTAVLAVSGKLKDRKRVSARTVAGVLGAIIFLLTGATFARNSVWTDEVRLWEDAAGKSPGKTWVQIKLGNAYQKKGLLNRAAERYRIAIRLSPDMPEAHNNLCYNYNSQGLFDKAIERCTIAVKLNPFHASAYYNMGIAYQSKGQFGKAVQHYKTAISIYSDDPSVHYNLATSYQALGLSDNAIASYKNVLRLEPNDSEAHHNLAIIYQTRGLIDNAIEHYTLAVQLDPDFADAHYNLGTVYQSKGLFDEAIYQYLITIKINPLNIKSHEQLSALYLKKGLQDKANEHSTKAMRLRQADEIMKK